MPRHTIHEAAVNAKLTVQNIGGKLIGGGSFTMFDMFTIISDSQVEDMLSSAVADKQYGSALFLSAILAERKNNQRRKKELEELSK